MKNCDDCIHQAVCYRYSYRLPENYADKCGDYLLQKSGKWISVSERLPEKSGRYLAYIVSIHDDKLRYIMTCEYFADGYWNWFPDDECASDNVIAWMPLPTPYEAESEDNE